MRFQSLVSLVGCLIVLTSLVANCAVAQPTSETILTPDNYGKVPLVVPAEAKAGPNFNVEQATRAWIETLSPEKRERSAAYFEGGYWLQLWGLIYGLLVAWIFLQFQISARMRSLSERVTGVSGLHTFAFATMYFVVSFLLYAPLFVYRDFLRERKYLLLNQNFGSWLSEQLIRLGFLIVLGGLALVIFYWVVRKTERNWWIWGAAVAALFISFAMLIEPVFIAPAFNDYHALEPSPVREKILSLARASGVPADDVFWFDASRQTDRISANVSGLGPTIRISLNDNLLSQCSRESIELVMAHEIAHYVLNHVFVGIVYFSLVLMGGFRFVDWGFRQVLKRWGADWQIRNLGDTAGFPLLVAVLSIYLFLMTPVLNSIVRVTEAEADLYALQASGQADGAAQVAMQLSNYRKISPGKWEEILFYDHPSGYSRIKMAMEYKAEQIRRTDP